MKNNCKWIVLLLLLCLAPIHVQASTSERLRDLLAQMQTNSLSVCEKGDAGSNVLAVKERLQTLGYYSATATFDDEFNDIMVQRVKLFQENNGLKMTGKVDSGTVSKLKESNPIRGEYYEGYWDEPDVTLVITYDSTGSWKNRGGDSLDFQIRVKNISTSRKITAVEFLVFTKDMWGDEIISQEYPYSYSLSDTFRPGEEKYTSYMNIPYRRNTHEVHVAVNKVRYSDGTVEYVSSPHYWWWTVD